MIKALLFDFSKTLLFAKDKTYTGGLNSLHRQVREDPNYNFFDHFELNSELLNYLETVKDKFGLYIYTSETIQEDPAVKDTLSKLFKKVFSAQLMNLPKKDPSSFKFIAKKLNLNPTEILFIDDSLGNLDIAKTAGIQTLHYTDSSIIDILKRL